MTRKMPRLINYKNIKTLKRLQVIAAFFYALWSCV